MTDAELSKELALALGYAPESVCIDTDKQGKYEPVCRVYRISYDMGPYWRWFDYRHPDVTLPLIEWLGSEHRIFFWWCGPTDQFGPRWSSSRCDISDTLAEAVAKACIALKVGHD